MAVRQTGNWRRSAFRISAGTVVASALLSLCATSGGSSWSVTPRDSLAPTQAPVHLTTDVTNTKWGPECFTVSKISHGVVTWQGVDVTVRYRKTLVCPLPGYITVQAQETGENVIDGAYKDKDFHAVITSWGTKDWVAKIGLYPRTEATLRIFIEYDFKRYDAPTKFTISTPGKPYSKPSISLGAVNSVPRAVSQEVKYRVADTRKIIIAVETSDVREQVWHTQFRCVEGYGPCPLEKTITLKDLGPYSLYTVRVVVMGQLIDTTYSQVLTFQAQRLDSEPDRG